MVVFFGLKRTVRGSMITVCLNHEKAKMDEFSAESNLQWAFNFVETTFTRKTVVENSNGTETEQEKIKYINAEDLKELLTNFGDTFTGKIFWSSEKFRSSKSKIQIRTLLIS